MSTCPTCGQELIVSNAPISNPPALHATGKYKNNKGEFAMIASSVDKIEVKNDQDIVTDTWVRVATDVAAKSPTVFNPSKPASPSTNTAETK